MGNFIVAITGGSGMPYARELSKKILQNNHNLKMVISDAGKKVLKVEESLVLTGDIKNDQKFLLEWIGYDKNKQFDLIDHKDVSASIASGSYKHDGMVIVPCSGGTLGRIANGISLGLIERAAHVCFKERRKLILVHRETPISLIDIENMRKVIEAGAVFMPASPGFYHKPSSIDDLITFVVDRILDHLFENHKSNKRWQGANNFGDEEEKENV